MSAMNAPSGFARRGSTPTYSATCKRACGVTRISPGIAARRTDRPREQPTTARHSVALIDAAASLYQRGVNRSNRRFLERQQTRRIAREQILRVSRDRAICRAERSENVTRSHHAIFGFEDEVADLE